MHRLQDRYDYCDYPFPKISIVAFFGSDMNSHYEKTALPLGRSVDSSTSSRRGLLFLH
jgi:hypothetical protein